MMVKLSTNTLHETINDDQQARLYYILYCDYICEASEKQFKL